MDSILYTIGHSNYALEDFVVLLRSQEIQVVVDVRSSPYSRYAKHFTGDVLKPALQACQFKYLYLGREIGGKPKDPELYDEEGGVRYDVIAATELFKQGMNRLENGVTKYKVAVMCGEENPTGCHRRHLIGKAAEQRGISVLHIRKGGVLNTEADLVAVENGDDPDVTQLRLFG